MLLGWKHDHDIYVYNEQFYVSVFFFFPFRLLINNTKIKFGEVVLSE